MSLDDWHIVFVSICLMVVLAACAPVAMAYLRIREEKFFALAVLGEEGMAEHYYPGNDPDIEVGEEVHWTIYLYNHMGEAQYVAVRMKLLNSTTLAPNSTYCTPSPAPVVYEARRVILDNETWLYPVTWSVEEVGLVGDFLNIHLLAVNGEYFVTSVVGRNGNNFRIVLELWVYNVSLDDFEFGWSYDDDMHCAWNQVWFNVTLPR